MRKILLAIAVIGMLVIPDYTPVSANSITVTRLADNAPTGSGNPSRNRAVEFGPNANTFYAFGGGISGVESSNSNQTWQYVIATDTWTQVANMPDARKFLYNLSTSNASASHIQLAYSTIANDRLVRSYDTISNTYDTAPNYPSIPDSWATLAVGINGYIHLFQAGLDPVHWRINMEGVIAWDVLTAPASGRTSQNAQVVYDSLRQRILVIPHNSAISYYYDVVSDSWDDVPTDLRPGGAAFHVSWYDPINGIIAGIATGETLELYRFNWTLRTFSPFATIEVPGLDYITFDGGFVRLKADARLTTGNNTLVILGTATTNSSAGGQTISNRWWSLQVGEITGTPNTADGWLIFLLDLFGFTDIGRTIAALGGLIVIGFILRLAGAHFLVSAPIMVFAVTGFTLIEFLPPWIIVTGAMLGGIALTIVLASGLGRNGGDDE